MNIKYVLCIIAICAVYSGAVDLMISHKIDRVRQDIVELKKEFSYDPKDAK